MEKSRGFGVYNIAVGRPSTIREVLKILLKADGYEEARISFDTTKPTMIPKRLIDTTKATKELGFNASVSLHCGLRKTISWYRQYAKS